MPLDAAAPSLEPVRPSESPVAHPHRRALLCTRHTRMFSSARACLPLAGVLGGFF